MSEVAQTTQASNSLKKKKSKNLVGFVKNIFIAIFLIGFAGSVAWGFWSYNMYQNAKNKINQLTSLDGQQELAQQEINAVLDKVKVHIQLPLDEEPVMATVVDASSLSEEQAFYKDASNGDRVIVYQKAQKAILYNPEKDIIINVGPIFLDEGSEEETKTPEETSEPSPSPETTTEEIIEETIDLTTEE